MKYISDITEAELKTSEAAHKNHRTAGPEPCACYNSELQRLRDAANS